MIEISMLVVGAFLVAIGVRILIILNKANKVDKDKILKRESGIFIEHGMVRAKNRVGVEADSKLSDVYYNSIA